MGFLELIGARRRGSGTNRLPTLLRLAPTAAASATLWALPAQGAAGDSPHPTDLRCTEGCAGRQTAAVGSTITVVGDRLNHVTEVDFRGRAGWIAARPSVTGQHRLAVDVPSGAKGGRPRVVARDGDTARIPKLLRIVSPTRLPDRNSFRLHGCGRHAQARLRGRRSHLPAALPLPRLRLAHGAGHPAAFGTRAAPVEGPGPPALHGTPAAVAGARSPTAARHRRGATGSRSPRRTTGGC